MKQKLWGVLCAAVLVACALCLYLGRDPNATADAPKTGSGIQLQEVSALQRDSLYKLGKVWGFVKYHHPDPAAGTVDWDSALFDVLPDLLAALSPAQANDVLAQWLAGYPFTVGSDATAESWRQIQAQQGDFSLDTGWISDRDFLGETVCRYLERLDQTYVGERTNGYAAFSADVAGVDFSHERDWTFRAEDDGIKLLALYRFWNAFAYYGPNVNITPVDWDQALREGIDEMLGARNRTAYLKALGSLAAKTGDAHASMMDDSLSLYRFYGAYFLRCSFLVIDRQIVVQYCDDRETSLHPGDVILAIDGTPMTDRIAELSRYFALPEPDKFGKILAIPLLNTKGPTAKVTVLRDGAQMELTAYTTNRLFVPENPWKNGTLENGQIGYIDPAALQEGDVEQLMESFSRTRGLIVDLRQYPSVFLPYLLGEYLMPEPTQFATLTLPNPALPGSYFRQESFYTGAGTLQATGQAGNTPYPPYTGKVVLLMNENSISQSEFTIMALRQSPQAVVVGSPSAGADGNAVNLKLPGNVLSSFTGMGVYTPDGEVTQRVGLQPDVTCLPTVEGLRDGRDELMDKAIEIIMQP